MPAVGDFWHMQHFINIVSMQLPRHLIEPVARLIKNREAPYVHFSRQTANSWRSACKSYCGHYRLKV